MSSEPDVVEFGPAHASAGSPAARRGGPRWQAIATDRRLTAALAVAGAVAAGASLVTEWQTVDTGAGQQATEEYFVNIPPLVNSVWAVPAGPVYLVGLMLVAAAAALALHGPPPARAAARVAGMGAAAVLVAVLATAAGAMTEIRGVSQFWAIETELLARFQVSLGGGVWAALAAVVLLGLALLTAHRREQPPVRSAASADDEPDDAEPREVELTVTTAAPFIRQY